MLPNFSTLLPGRLLRLAAFLAALACLWQGTAAVRPMRATTTVVTPQPALKTQPIAALRVGQRALADNPELVGPALPDAPIDPELWRLVRLEMAKPDGGRLEIDLLRPVTWLLEEILDLADADPSVLWPRPLTVAAAELPLCEHLLGRTIPLDLPELGAEGPATVMAIEPCPALEAAGRPGRRLITGTFRHSAGNLLDVQIAGEPIPLGVTDNHPFWSEDRQTFVPAGELRPGERLRRADQTLTQVTRITPRTGPPVPVYNLEVDAEHVYHVGASGVLVHNSYRTYITYIGWDVDAALPYVGRASGFGTPMEILKKRMSSHHRKLIGEYVEYSTNSYAEVRGREQLLIDRMFNGLHNVANDINGISIRNGKFQRYINAALNGWGYP